MYALCNRNSKEKQIADARLSRSAHAEAPAKGEEEGAPEEEEDKADVSEEAEEDEEEPEDVS